MLAPYLAQVLTHPRKILNFIRKLRIARAYYGRPYRVLLARVFDLLVNEHFTPKDVFLWDLLAMDSRDEVRRSVISKTDLLKMQQRLNPRTAAVLTEDKGVFSGYCQACGLPAPRLLAVIGRRIGWTGDGALLCGEAQWVRFFDRLAESEIVIKPTHGAYGRGVRFLSRRGERWSDEAGRLMTAAEVPEALRRDSRFSDYVVEERVRPHPDLVRLSGTDYLQTTRIVTAVSGYGEVEIILVVMKLIGGRATTDNFDFGSTGNLVSKVCVATGRLEWVRTARPDGVGLVEVTRHPATGVSLRDFQLPDWPEALDLARRAALQFLPLLTIGWDIAFTPSGPLLIEGNTWWDPPNQLRWVEKFRAYSQALLERPARRRRSA